MNPNEFTALSGAIAVIIGALATGIVLIIKAIRETKTVVDKVATVNNVQTNKLDRIEVLVDGRYGEVLQELADVKRLFAENTGKAGDMTKATEAQNKADEQVARVHLAPKAVGLPAQIIEDK